MPDETPDWRAAIHARLAAARLHPQDEAELIEEVAQHLEEQFADLSPRVGVAAARDTLLAQLANTEFDDAIARRRRRAQPTRARVWSSASFRRDVRYGLRSLRRSPGMVAAGTIALALGIGLTTVMYSVIYGMLIKGLPFQYAERIAGIYYADPARMDDQIPLSDFVHYRQDQRSFEAIGGYNLGTVNVSGGDRPERVSVTRVTAGLLDVTSVRPLLGRLFVRADNDPAAPATVMLDYTMWRDQFRADSSAIGKEVRLAGKPFTIIGVMPEGFAFPSRSKVWAPIQTNAASLPLGEGPGLTLAGRLRPGATFEQANAEFATLSHQLFAQRPRDVTERRAVVQPFVRAMVPGRVYAVVYVMLSAVMLVLLVACANVANLLLDRTLGRTREIGIRTALGASRLAVVRQSLVESALLAGLAAIIGTVLAQAGIMMFNDASVDADLYFWTDIRLHPAVLAFVVVLAAIASVVSGLLPAMQSARLDVSSILKDESHAASSLRVGRLSRTIVGVEIAVSAMLLVAAGFMTRSLMNIRAIEPGFRTADIYTARVSLTSRDTVRQRAFFEALERDLLAVPGAKGVFLGSGLPGAGWGGDRVFVEGRAYARGRDVPFTRTLAVTPGFFSTFGVRVLSGRPITSADRLETPRVAVVSEAFARRVLGVEDPIGRRVRVGGSPNDTSWVTIVGVMPTVYASSFNFQNPWPPELVTALWQEGSITAASIAVRGPTDVAAAAAIRRIVAALDPEIPVYDADSMSDVLSRPLWPVWIFGTMFMIFGAVSLVLAAIGLYAVMAFSVSRRVREMGIRMALGATGGDVIRMVCRQGARQIGIGLAVGLVAGAAIVRAARPALFRVNPSDPAVFGVVGGVLALVAFIACLVPAVRATRVDSVVALRMD